MLSETFNDLILFACVWHEVIIDHMCINQSLNVEFLLEDLCNQSVFLIRLEALVLRAARVFEGQCLVLILDLD